MDENGDDPFASLAHFCTISDSQEEFLRRCPFAGDASAFTDSQGFPLHPPGVFMASLPQSFEQRQQIAPQAQDAYQTPPEQSAPAASGGHQSLPVDDPARQDSVAVAGGAEVVGSIGDATAIDLGKDTDLGFQLEVQSTRRIAEIENTGVCRSEIPESEPASKRLKLSKEPLGTPSSGPIVGEKPLVDLDSTKSGEESKLMDETTEKLVRENNGDQCRRVLPSSINGAKGNAEKKTKESDATRSGNSGKPMSIVLEILKMIGDEEGGEDDSLANLSILDIVMRRGMTFPRPCWWPEGQDFSFK